MHHHRTVQVIGDTVATSVVAASMTGILPDLAAAAAILWYLLQFYIWWEGRRKK